MDATSCSCSSSRRASRLGRPGTFSAVQIAAQNTSIGGGNFSVNGMRDVYNDYLLDGVSFKDWIHGTNGMNPVCRCHPGVPHADQQLLGGVRREQRRRRQHADQVRAPTSCTAAPTSTCATTRSTPRTSSRTPSAPQAAAAPQSVRRDGRRYRSCKNKTFFFGSYEGFRERRASTLISHVPDARRCTAATSRSCSRCPIRSSFTIRDRAAVSGQRHPGRSGAGGHARAISTPMCRCPTGQGWFRTTSWMARARTIPISTSRVPTTLSATRRSSSRATSTTRSRTIRHHPQPELLRLGQQPRRRT